jgi:hypothetical protein
VITVVHWTCSSSLFLKLVLARRMAEIDRNCKFGCTATEWDHNFVDDIPFLLYRIEMLPLEIMRLQEAEQAVEKKRSVCGVY